jgi:hypothetical protein
LGEKGTDGRGGKRKQTAVEEDMDMDEELSREELEELPALVDLAKVRGSMLCEEMGGTPQRRPV